MKLKLSLAAAAAVFSGALFLSDSAHAQANTDKKNSQTKTKTVTVKSGDTLSSIARAHGTTYVKLYNANKSLANPDVIDVGDKIRIPAKNEKLEDRFSKLQQQVAAAPAPSATEYVPVYSSTYTPGSQAVYATDSAGNTYFKGYCTWYAKSKRPDLPNMLGNGGEWSANAAARGFKTGSTPRKGAIAETTGHVAYVERVNKDGTITISEMNGQAGFGKVGTRNVPAGKYRYIYR